MTLLTTHTFATIDEMLLLLYYIRDRTHTQYDFLVQAVLGDLT